LLRLHKCNAFGIMGIKADVLINFLAERGSR